MDYATRYRSPIGSLAVAEIESAADSGYRLADGSAEVSHLRVPPAFLHAYAYRPADALTQLDATIARSATAQAWVCAAEGAVSQAISITREAAAKECQLGREAGIVN